MRWALLVVFIVAGLLASERTSLACMNATMSENEAVRKLKEADVALDEGDVVTARALAHDVHHIYGYFAPELTSSLVVRAARVEALSYVRDRAASDADLTKAVTILRRWVQQKDEIRGSLPPAPALLADYGEALERAARRWP